MLVGESLKLPLYVYMTTFGAEEYSEKFTS